MDARSYLKQVKNSDNRIRDLIKEAVKWENIAMSAGGTNFTDVKVQTSPKHDKLGDAVSMAVDYQNKCKREAAQLTELRHTIIEQIKGMKDDKDDLYYNLLYGYYVDGKSFSKMVVSENYSYRQIKRHFNKALEEFDKLYKTQYIELIPLDYAENA